MDLVWRIIFTSLLMHSSFGTTLNISFDLEDSEINEIIFVDETDIALRCYVTGEANDFEISIEHESRDDPVLLSRNDNCLKYVIKNVTMNDGGKYTCNISFIDVDGSTQTAAKTLYLNVQDGITPQCFRNGTAGQPYNDGDLLLITCYCRNSVTSCQWISSASRLGNHVVPYETKSRFDKMILRLLVKVGSSSSFSLTTRYQCFNGPASTQRCQIGPQMNSSTDFIINTYTEDSSYNVDCVKQNTSPFTSQKEEVTAMTLNTIPVTLKTEEESRSTVVTRTASNTANTVFVGIVIGASVGAIVVVVITILLIVFILMKRRKHGTHAANPGENHLYSNNGYRSDEHQNDNRNGPTDSHYYDINPNEENCQMDHNVKPRENEANTYMRTIMHM